MNYEVEQKYPVDQLEPVASRLRALEVVWLSEERHEDQYFNHPQRDFGETDEALRLRRKNERCLITYKGPRIDDQTKTREELELPLESASCPGFESLLLKLGFHPVGVVRKHRRPCRVTRDQFEVEIVLDRVDGLGNFVELEISATAEDVAAAQLVLHALADELKLGDGERRSYLELLLGKQDVS